RSPETVHYTLVFIPESGPDGTWVEVARKRIVCGRDDPARTATDALQSLRESPVRTAHHAAAEAQTPGHRSPQSNKIYVIGFQQHDRAKAELVTKAGLTGVAADDCAGCLYELLARGAFSGSLIHSPNVYDYPAAMQLVRVLGGDSVWVHNRQ